MPSITTTPSSTRLKGHSSVSQSVTEFKIALLSFSPVSLSPAVALTAIGVHDCSFLGMYATASSSSGLSDSAASVGLPA